MMKTNDKQAILSATLRTVKVERGSKTNDNKKIYTLFFRNRKTEYINRF